MKQLYRVAWAVLLLFLLLPVGAHAQDGAEPAVEPIVLGERLVIPSDALGEARTVLVYLPAGYQNPEARYPVLYLLDGDRHLLHTSGIIDHLATNGRMPEMIVVALPNTDRTRDLTPAPAAPVENLPTAGGADHFLRFLADELQPFIEARYRTQPYRVLVGHSFGGLFALHALTSRPEAFNSYIAISPSLWWDEEAPIQRAEAFLTMHPETDRHLYFTMGNEGGRMIEGANKLAAIFEAKAPETFAWQFRLFEDEDHGSVPHRSTYHGLEAIFAAWRLPEEIARTTSLDALDAHYAALSERLGYVVPTPEAFINRLGYRLLAQNQVDEAIVAFRRNATQYPASPNVYDSLGDGLDRAGQHAEAHASYLRACTLGRAAGDPNTGIYCANAERLARQVSGSE